MALKLFSFSFFQLSTDPFFLSTVLMVNILTLRGVAQKFCYPSVLLMQQGFRVIDGLFIILFWMTAQHPSREYWIKKSPVFAEGICWKQMPEPWGCHFPSGSNIRVSNTSKTLCVLASTNSCGASCFLLLLYLVLTFLLDGKIDKEALVFESILIWLYCKCLHLSNISY